MLLKTFSWLSFKNRDVDGKYIFFKIILPTFLCFRMVNRDFTYYCQDLDEKLKCSSSSWKLDWSYFYDWSNAAWSIWWLKQSIKLYKLNESIVAITNTSRVYILTCVWVFCFLKVQKFTVSPTLALNYTKATRSRVVLVSKLPFLSFDFTYDIKSTSWKRCYLVTSSRLIHTYFTIQGSFLLIYKQELKSGKVTSFFSKSTYLYKKIFISRSDVITVIYKSWSLRSGWLTLFVRSKVTRGDSFNNRLY